jgi:hypothetical protein
MRSLASEALSMVERPVKECIADVYNLLITSARWGQARRGVAVGQEGRRQRRCAARCR